MSQAPANLGSEHWENINPADAFVDVPMPSVKKRGRSGTIFLTALNTILSLGVGIAIGFFAFWYTIGPQNHAAAIPKIANAKDLLSQGQKVTDTKVLAAHSDNVVINMPQIGAKVGQPMQIEGSVRLLDQSLMARLRNSKGVVILEKKLAIKPTIRGEFSDFDFSLTYPKQPSNTTGTVEVYTKLDTNGRTADLIQVPIIFK